MQFDFQAQEANTQKLHLILAPGLLCLDQMGVVFSADLENAQADMYNYTVTSYMRHVPKAQRYGVTIWGTLDNQSWRYKSGADYPLLYTATGVKKRAYEFVLRALQSGL